ncbi:MAG TPA: hypothetical protein VFT22_13445 [Kofleriaceae bacterium]|nr:hypothetical protein [Kofleriaceae bacterium]
MRALDAEVDDAKALAQRRRERGLPDRLVREPSAQAADRGGRSQHDVDRMARVELGAGPVRRACAPALGLATRTAALAPARLPQQQLPGLRSAATLATPIALPDLRSATSLATPIALPDLHASE